MMVVFLTPGAERSRGFRDRHEMGNSVKTFTTPLIRLAHPQAFSMFLQEIGAPTDRLFRSQGLPMYCDDPSAFVPLRQAWALFDAAAQLEDPMLGWHVGRFYGDNKLSVGLLKKIENAPTIYQALQSVVRLISAEASHLELGIVERRDDIVFFTRYSTIKDWPGYTSSQSYQLEVYLDLIRHYVGRHWVPEEIGIEYPTVPQVAEEHFPGTRIMTSQRLGYITVPRSCLHLGARSSHPEAGIEEPLFLAKDFGYLDTLKAVIKAYLTDGYPSARKVAALTDTSVRSLARRLSDLGLSYRAVVDDVRFSVAKELLRDSDASIGDVAGGVGFDDPAHFTRMFRRIGGLTPRDFRRATTG